MLNNFLLFLSTVSSPVDAAPELSTASKNNLASSQPSKSIETATKPTSVSTQNTKPNQPAASIKHDNINSSNAGNDDTKIKMPQPNVVSSAKIPEVKLSEGKGDKKQLSETKVEDGKMGVEPKISATAVKGIESAVKPGNEAAGKMLGDNPGSELNRRVSETNSNQDTGIFSTDSTSETRSIGSVRYVFKDFFLNFINFYLTFFQC